ncbi:hypothetical protein [Sporosarcina sp. Te-1]|uniref:hypothetical protein n=1 Tax=Sporosarcina sp. Te-1 TaxID=2818390 RepID=UPI001A9D775C|nr:hypothetical protein [Sporosarcina sp. Te-1]QTD41411.1 hypothetical protein J3U78_00640 [Sporosarcina sp. Te-1]
MIKRVCLTLLFVLSIMVSGFSVNEVLADGSIDFRSDNPLYDDKEVLNYLLWTMDEKLEKDVEKLKDDLNLSDEEMDFLKDWGLKERSMVIESLNQVSPQDQEDAAIFNRIAGDVFASRNQALQEFFGDRYSSLEEWISAWWKEEIDYRNQWLAARTDVNAGIDRVSGIFATQYNPNTSGAYEVALPDKYVKFANLGWVSNIPSNLRSIYGKPPYVVNVYNPATGRSVRSVKVDEVGPWNTDDNYWDAKSGTNPRRKFADLPLGTPQAYAAYTNGHNGGKDQSGRKVLNPAGIDLTPRVATDLGLKSLQNAWIDVRYEYLP